MIRFSVQMCTLLLVLLLGVETSEAAPPIKRMKLCIVDGQIVAKKKCKSTETQLTVANALAELGYSPYEDPRPYGDGSAGAWTVSDTELLNDVSNRQYTDITIETSGILTVPSGTILRCTGTFTLRGSLYVSSHNELRTVSYSGALGGLLAPTIYAPGSGIAHSSAAFGQSGTVAGGTRFGGGGGRGLESEAEARGLLHPGNRGGGDGAAAQGGTPGEGAGSLTVLCKTAIVIESTGTIFAAGGVGASGSGGGGGGVVILASSGSIQHEGSIQAPGGIGGYNPTDDTNAAGGGGGGGVVQMLAPSIVDLGTVNVSGGAGGPAYVAGTISSSIVHGGGGGGASGGNGGGGGDVNTNGSSTSSDDGEDGYFIKSTLDPAGLY